MTAVELEKLAEWYASFAPFPGLWKIWDTLYPKEKQLIREISKLKVIKNEL